MGSLGGVGGLFLAPPEARWLVFPDNKNTQGTKKLFLFFGGGRLLAARDNKLWLCFLGLDVRRVHFHITRITTLLVVHREPGVCTPVVKPSIYLRRFPRRKPVHVDSDEVESVCVSQGESAVDQAAQSTKAVHE